MSSVKDIFSNSSNIPQRGKSRRGKKNPIPSTTTTTRVIQGILNNVSSEVPNLPRVRNTDLKRKNAIEHSSKLDHKLNDNVFEGTLPEGGRLEALAKWLAHIHGDRIVKGSRLEREDLPSHEGAKLLQEYLQNHSQDLADKMGQLTTLSEMNRESPDRKELADDVMQRVVELNEGESYLVPGIAHISQEKRWRSLSFTYEFCKNEEGSYDLYVYSIGTHDRWSVEAAFVKDRYRLPPYLTFKNIPEEQLFFSKEQDTRRSSLFQAILEMGYTSKVSPEFAMTGLLGHLYAYYEEPNFKNAEDGSLSAPLSLLDGWHSMKGFIFRHLGKEEYKKFVLEMKYRSLIEGYQLCKGDLERDTVEADELRTLLKEGAEGILRKLAKNHKSNLVTEQTALTYEATALDVLKRLEDSKKKIVAQRRKKLIDVDLTATKKGQTEEGKNALKAASASIRPAPLQNHTIGTTPCEFPALSESTKVLEQLKELNQRLAASKTGDATRAADIEHLVNQFPIPENEKDQTSFWANIPNDHLNDVLVELGTLVSCYEKALRAFPLALTPREVNTVFSLYAVIHYLAVRYDNQVNTASEGDASRLASYMVFFPGRYWDRDPYLMHTDPETYTRSEKWMRYFETTNREKEQKLAGKKKVTQLLGAIKREDTLFNFSKMMCSILSPDTVNTADKEASYRFYAAFAEHHHLHESLGLTPEAQPVALVAKVLSHLGLGQDNPLVKAKRGHLSVLATAAFVATQFSEMPEMRVLDSDLDTLLSIKTRRVDPNQDPQDWEVESLSSLTAEQLNQRKEILVYFYWGLDERFNPAKEAKDDRFLIAPVLRSKHLHPPMPLLEGPYPSLRNPYYLNLRPPVEFDITQASAKKMGDSEKWILTKEIEPDLLPFKLAYGGLADLSAFADPKNQARFQLDLFRSLIRVRFSKESWEEIDTKRYENRTFLEECFPWVSEIKKEEPATNDWMPLLKQMQQSGLIGVYSQFIKEGIATHYDRTPVGRPNVHATLFFLRLASWLAHFTKDKEPLVDSVAYINKMLTLPDLTPEEKSALSLHLVLGYSVDKRALNREQKYAILQAWVYYCTTSLSPQWKNIWLEKEMLRFVQTVKIDFFNDEEQRALLNSALKQLDMRELDHGYQFVKSDFPNIYARNENGNFWKLNAHTGQVANEQGVLKKDATPLWIQKSGYPLENVDLELCRRIFEDRSHKYTQVGTTIHFTDSKLGRLRVLGTTLQEGLQREIGGQWMQFVPPSNPGLVEGIPRSLLADHTHWVATEGEEKYLLICALETGECVAKLCADGTLHPYHPSSQSFDTTKTLTAASEHSVFEKIDLPTYILCTSTPNQLERVVFTRYCSQSGEPLAFHIEDGVAYFELNKKYFLEKQQMSGLVGGMSNYLILSSKENGKKKVLIPRLPITESHLLTDQGKLGYCQKLDIEKELTSPQARSYTFLEYDLKGDRLVPLTTEGALQLAYIYLSQREYDEAKKLIDSLDFRLPLSSLSRTILDDFFAYKDSSPRAAAIIVAINILRNKVRNRSAIKESNATQEGVMSDIHATYFRYKKVLPLALRSLNILKPGNKGTRLTSKRETLKAPLSLNLDLLDSSDPGLERKVNFNHAKVRTEFLRKKFEQKETQALLPDTEGFFHTAYELLQRGSAVDRAELNFKLQISNELAVSFGAKQETRLSDTNIADPLRILVFFINYPGDMPTLPKNRGEDPQSIRDCWQFLQDVEALISKKAQDQNFVLPGVYYPGSPQERVKFQETYLQSPKKEESKGPLKLYLPDEKELDQGFLSTVFTESLSSIKSTLQDADGEQFTYEVKEEVSFEESVAQNAIQEEFRMFQKGFNEGAAQLKKAERYRVNDLEKLKTTLSKKSEALKSDLHNLEVILMELANTQHSDSEIKERRLLEANVREEVSMKKLVWAFLSSDAERFKGLNAHLASEAFDQLIADELKIKKVEGCGIDYLYHLVGHFLQVSVYQKRLGRVLQHIERAQDSSLGTLEKEVEEQHIARELDPKILNAYNSNEYPAFLVFEYTSDLAIQPDQVEHLKKMLEIDPSSQKYRNYVAQMMMGGGKTTVLAIILLKLAAGRGKLSLFVTLDSQYSSVSTNLRKTLKETFDQEMEEIDFPEDKIYENCEEILKRMQETKQRGDFLPTRAEILQFLLLKFITAIFDNDSGKLQKINTLRRILLMLREDGEVLIDEIDSVLDLLKEVNFALGEEQHVQFDRIDLIRELFGLFVSENAQISDNETINLKALIGLEEDKQTELSQQAFRGKVTKAVAWYFCKSEEDRLFLKDHPEHHESFYRYLSGQIAPNCQKALDASSDEARQSLLNKFNDQERRDFQFLEYVRSLFDSAEMEKQEAANQIALLKHMLLKVLPSTFQGQANRNFGRRDNNKNKKQQKTTGEQQPGFVCPYVAVDTPATSQFGYVYEWIAFHFQTVLNKSIGISEEQLRSLVVLYGQRSADSIESNRLVWDEQKRKHIAPEALEFKNLTGFGLEEMSREETLKAALTNINNNLTARLILEAQTASSQVVYYKERVTANGFSLANIANPRGMSGTPYNIHAQEDCLSNTFKEECTIAGKIAAQVCARILSEKKKHIHIAPSKTPNALLDTILENHPEKDKVRMLLDAGALLKDFSNLDVAKAMRAKTGKPVLFFVRDKSKDEKTPDSLALLPLGSDNIRIIGGTRWVDIEKTGLSLKDFVVYLDEAHTTGTNLKLPVDSIGVMTVDSLMLSRTFFQTILRLRGFFDHQKIEFVVSSADPQSSQDSLKTVKQALIQSITNQAFRKVDDYFRSRRQKIESLAEQEFLNRAVTSKELNSEDLQALASFRPCLVHQIEDSPYKNVGAIEVPVKSADDLTAISRRQQQLLGPDSPEAQLIAVRAEEVIEEAQKSLWFPEKVLSTDATDLGMHMTVLERNQRQRIQERTEIEVKEELSSYSSSHLSERKEYEWTDESISHFLKQPTPENQSPILQQNNPIKSLSQTLSEYKYQKEYNTLFDSRILTTTNWAQMCTNKLSIFHKMRRPIEQVLVIKTSNGEYRTLLLSQKEGARFKQFLNEQYKKNKYSNVWLVMPDMTLLEDNPHSKLNPQDVADLFVQINAIEGNISYLQQHFDSMQKWLARDLELSIRFLKLTLASNPRRELQFSDSPYFNPNARNQKKLLSDRQKVAHYDRDQIQAIDEENKHLLWLLPTSKLQSIHPTQIKWLAPHQIPQLRGELVSSIPKEFRKLIDSSQFDDLSEEQKNWDRTLPLEESVSDPESSDLSFEPSSQDSGESSPQKSTENESSSSKDEEALKSNTEVERSLPAKKMKKKKVRKNPVKIEEAAEHTTSPLKKANTVTSSKPAVAPPGKKKKISHIKKAKAADHSRSCTITHIALAALEAVCLTATAVGVVSLVGSHFSWAPRVFVQLSEILKWPAARYLLTAAGPAYLCGLGFFMWINKSRRTSVSHVRA